MPLPRGPTLGALSVKARASLAACLQAATGPLRYMIQVVSGLGVAVPLMGASSITRPCRLSSRTAQSLSASGRVLVSITICPRWAGATSAHSCTTERRASALGRDRISTCAWPATSALEPGVCTPARAHRWRSRATGSWPQTSWPWASSVRAMMLPMVPRPMRPTRSGGALMSRPPRRRRSRARTPRPGWSATRGPQPTLAHAGCAAAPGADAAAGRAGPRCTGAARCP